MSTTSLPPARTPASPRGSVARTGRQFIFRVASDSDCEKEHGRIQFWRDRKLYNYGLRHADLVAAQTEFQAQMLRENHEIESAVVNMMVEPPRTGSARSRKTSTCLWVSNLRALKRPELALELARQLPQVKFTLAGGPMPGGETYYEDVRAAAARLPNVTMPGAVRYADSGALFDRAKIFLNTSSIEGFPNTFLQAWIRGVPVVSFFDPDSLVQRLQLGHIANSIDEMREAIRGLLEDDVRSRADRPPRARFRDARIHHGGRGPLSRTTESEIAADAAGRRSLGKGSRSAMTNPTCLAPPMKQPLTLVTPRETQRAVATPACDVLFVLSNLAVGGSERKIVRLANRLKEEGVAVEPGLSQRAVHARADAAPRRAAGQARAPRKVLVRDGAAPAADDPARAAGDGGRGESVPGAVRGLRDAAAAASAAHRGAGQHLDVPRPASAEAPLPVGAGALRSHRARLAGAKPLLG